MNSETKANENPEVSAYDTAKGTNEPIIKLCPECHCVQVPRARECPQCGHVFGRLPPKVIEGAGELIELGAAARDQGYSRQSQAQFFGMLKFYGETKGYELGWAARQFLEKFGHRPNDPAIRNAAPIPLT